MCPAPLSCRHHTSLMHKIPCREAPVTEMNPATTSKEVCIQWGKGLSSPAAATRPGPSFKDTGLPLPCWGNIYRESGSQLQQRLPQRGSQELKAASEETVL